jgi:uncharacterized protein YkwD
MKLITIIFPILFGQYSGEESSLFMEANNYRQKNGLHQLSLNDSLSDIAKKHCINLNQHHNIQSGISMHDWYDDSKKRWVVVYANEIAHGHEKTGWDSNCNHKCCLSAWIKSKSHRQSLKSKTFTQMGVAIYKNYAIILFN